MINVDVLQPADLDELEKAVATLNSRLDTEADTRLNDDTALSERLTKVEGYAAPPAYDESALKARVTALEPKVSTLETKAAANTTKDAEQDSRLTSLEARPTGTGGTTIVRGEGYYLDNYTGTDDEKLTAAIAAQRGSGGTTNMAPIILPSRRMNFNLTRGVYSGLKVKGEHVSGQKNPELAGGDYVGPEIVLGGAIGKNDKSWWVGTGSIYDVFMADFSVQGSQGSYRQQFFDQASGTLYACEFDSLSFNFMDGVFGNSTRKCLFTQVALTGTWTINNIWGTAIYVGGSDSQLWKEGFVNMGPSASPAQTGNVNSYQIVLDSFGKSKVGEVYMSSLNGWRGLKQSGNSSYISYFGGTYEGYKPSGSTSGGQPLAASGTMFRMDGGCANFYGADFGQAMAAPDASEKGYIQLNNGELLLSGCNFYGDNLGSVAAVEQKAGRLTSIGNHRVQTAAWTNRPRVLKTGGEFFAPDGSMTL